MSVGAAGEGLREQLGKDLNVATTLAMLAVFDRADLSCLVLEM